MKTLNELRERSQKTKTMKDIMRVHGKALKKAERSGNLDLPTDVEDALKSWVFKNEPRIGDDPDDFDEWLDDNLEDIVKGKIKEDVNEIIERIDFHKKSPAEKKGSDFDRKSEINGYKKILKEVEKLNKFHEKFQYNNRADGPSNIFKGLQQVERTCYDLIREIEQGKWDGKVDLED